MVAIIKGEAIIEFKGNIKSHEHLELTLEKLNIPFKNINTFILDFKKYPYLGYDKFRKQLVQFTSLDFVTESRFLNNDCKIVNIF